MTRKLIALLLALATLALGPAAVSEGVTWTCPTCHLSGITDRTCPRCATWRPADGSADDPVEEPAEETGARWITDFDITMVSTCSARVDWSEFAEAHPGGYTLEWVYSDNPDIRYTTSPEAGTHALIALAPGIATRVRLYYNPNDGVDLSVTADPDPAREKEIPGDLPDAPPVDFLASRYEIGAYSKSTGGFKAVNRLGDEADALFRVSGDEQLAIRYRVRFKVDREERVLFTWMLRSPEGYVYLGVEAKHPEPDSPDVEGIYPLGEMTREFLNYNDVTSGDYWVELYAEGYPVCKRSVNVDQGGAGRDEWIDAAPTPTPTPVPAPGSYPGLSGEAQPIANFAGGGGSRLSQLTFVGYNRTIFSNTA